MPQPKGHEPFSRFWQVRWSIYSSPQFARGWPRVEIFATEGEADAWIANLDAISVAVPAQGRVIKQSWIKTGPMLYFNRKSFVATFVSGIAESIQVSG